jgi:hypothetical protein
MSTSINKNKTIADESGQVSVEGKEHEERTEDCDICNYH